jgi:hypothetical protein
MLAKRASDVQRQTAARRHASTTAPMYATCLYCHAHLGANDVVESFPVGRRLAFDVAKGRLWVVCGRCRRWNLTPIEERWEAVEACERLFRDTRLRTSTDNVGLARLREGLELVRIGRPLRPEFAAWRYGAELARRRVRDLAGGLATGVGALVLLGGGSLAAAALVGPFGVVAGPALLVGGSAAMTKRQLGRAVARVEATRAHTVDVRQVTVRERDLRTLHLRPGADGLHVRLHVDVGRIEITGEAAVRVAALACARRNQIGASVATVQEAVRWVEARGGPDGLLRATGAPRELRRVPYVERLALEMALHEDAERQALEEELTRLEAAWREADAIAAIADDLLLPPRVHALLRRHRVP